MKHLFLIMILGLSLVGCGKPESVQASADKNVQLFSSWTSDTMTLDLSKGHEGIFDIVVYHIWEDGNSGKCFATLHLYDNQAKVIDYWIIPEPPGHMYYDNHCTEILRNKVFDFTQSAETLSVCDQDKQCRKFHK